MGPAHLEFANKNKAFTRINVIKDGGEKIPKARCWEAGIGGQFLGSVHNHGCGIRKTPLSAELEQPSVSYAKLF